MSYRNQSRFTQLKYLAIILFNTFLLFGCIDFAYTKISGIRGFTSFLTQDPYVGFINKPNFDGVFGGALDDFSSKVTTGKMGERVSWTCPTNPSSNIIFLGDSTTAGFEVLDNETFISKFNKYQCDSKQSPLNGLNFGVRAYDTHLAISNYKRIKDKINHKFVFLLVTGNDILENITPVHYKSLVDKFGRNFDGNLYYPKHITPRITELYYSTRIFISDNFYLSTKIIRYIETILDKFKTKKILKPDTHEGMNKTLQLIINLSILSKESNAKLIISGYPCFDLENCLEINFEEELNKLISGGLINNTMLLPLANICRDNNISDCHSLIFKNDPHLSKMGHEIVAKQLQMLRLFNE